MASRNSSSVKTGEKRRYQAGDCLKCAVCGLAVRVDENFAYREKSLLMCCQAPMELVGQAGKPAKKPASG